MLAHRLARVAFTVGLCVAILAGTDTPAARADFAQIFFDFVAPYDGQVGSYVTSPGATLSGGVGSLVPDPGLSWFDASWQARRPLLVSFGSIATEQQIRIEIDPAVDPGLAEIFNVARPDGADLRLVDPTGAVVSPIWVAEFDGANLRATLWAKVSSSGVGVEGYHLYYGNPAAPDVSDKESVFTFSTPHPTAVVLSTLAAGQDHEVMAFYPATTLVVGTTMLGLGPGPGTTTLAGADATFGALLEADKPVFAAVPGIDTVYAPVPLATASTSFTYPAERGSVNVWAIYAPFGNADVTVSENGVPQICDGVAATTCAVPGGTGTELNIDLGAVTVVDIDATAAVVAAHWSTDFNDSFVMFAPAVEWWGYESGTVRMAGTVNGTTVTGYFHDASSNAYAVNDDATTSFGGAQFGAGRGIRLIGTDPFAVYANAEGDGGDAITFLPRSELDTTYLLPTSADYVRIVTTGVGTVCVRDEPAAGMTMGQASVSVPPPFPGLIQFGVTEAGTVIDCDAPAFVMYEDTTTQDERNAFALTLHRTVGPNAASAGPLNTEETRYPTTPETVDTPEYLSSSLIDDWTGFAATTVAPPGTSVRFQLSMDGGSSWLWHDGNAWSTSASLTDANTESEIDAAVSTLPTTTSVRVRTILQSSDGRETPLIDSITIDVNESAVGARLIVLPIASPQGVDVPFTVQIQMVDPADNPIVSFSGSAMLSASAGVPVAPTSTGAFTAGEVTVDVTALAPGTAVVLIADTGGVTGVSNAFDVEGRAAAELEYVSGDMQIGTVGELLSDLAVVRAVDAGGDPLANVIVTFSVTEGNGTVRVFEDGSSDPVASIITEGDGLARAAWTLGPEPGANEVVASAPGESGTDHEVVFGARGDEEDTGNGNGGGGCGCRIAGDVARAARDGQPPTGGPGGWLALCACTALALALRRRRHTRPAGR